MNFKIQILQSSNSWLNTKSSILTQMLLNKSCLWNTSKLFCDICDKDPEHRSYAVIQYDMKTKVFNAQFFANTSIFIRDIANCLGPLLCKPVCLTQLNRQLWLFLVNGVKTQFAEHNSILFWFKLPPPCLLLFKFYCMSCAQRVFYIAENWLSERS